MNNGHLYVISAPSGTGKTSLVKALIKKDPTIRLSVSTTTREPRAGEVNGRDYFFVNKEDFDKQINHSEFIEWAFVYGNFYGTSATLVKNSINRGEKVLLEIDWQGAFQIKKRYNRDMLTLIFIVPPSLDISCVAGRLYGAAVDAERPVRVRVLGPHQAPQRKSLVRIFWMDEAQLCQGLS